MPIPGERVVANIERRGRPASKATQDMESRLPVTSSGSGIAGIAWDAIYFYTRDIDGGVIGAMGEAMDYLDTTLDGGTF